MFYVYLIQSKQDDSLYIGKTCDLKRRFKEHNEGKSQATKFKAPFKLVYYEAYSVEQDADKRERQLKRHAGATTALKRRLSI